MNRIDVLFQQKTNNVLSVYFTAGFPNLDDTTPVLKSLQTHGVDLVEIGIPFSDPIADGPVIQQSNHQALANGMSIRYLFKQLTSIRSQIRIPLVLMGYLNPIMQFGFEEFCAECQRVDIDGMIIPDLPMVDYLSEFKPIADKYGLKFIFLITPETSSERIYEIDNQTDGFIYMVSAAAVTGTKQSFNDSIAYFERVRNMSLKNPKLIGFGVSNKATLSLVNQHATGAIVGSAFVKLLQNGMGIDESVQKLLENLNN